MSDEFMHLILAYGAAMARAGEAKALNNAAEYDLMADIARELQAKISDISKNFFKGV